MKTKNFLQNYRWLVDHPPQPPLDLLKFRIGESRAELDYETLSKLHQKTWDILKNHRYSVSEALEQHSNLLKNIIDLLFYDPVSDGDTKADRAPNLSQTHKESRTDQNRMRFYDTPLFEDVFIYILKNKKIRHIKKILNLILTNCMNDNADRIDQVKSGSSNLRLEHIDVNLSPRNQIFIDKILNFFTNNSEHHICIEIKELNDDLGHLQREGLQKLADKFFSEGFNSALQNSSPHNPFISPAPNSAFIKRFVISCCQKIENLQHLKFFLDWLDEINNDRNLDATNLNNHKITFGLPSLCVGALFKPFLNEIENDYDTLSYKKLKGRVEKTADKILGDPRFNPAAWVQIPDAKNTMLRWKTAKSLDNFFSLVDELAEENEDVRRMWPRRRKFIKIYYDSMHINDAWFVLGRDAAQHRNREKFLKSKGNDYAELKGKSDHAALIFRIGDLILVERNYNAKVRIWRDGVGSCPKLYVSEYHSVNDLQFKNEKKPSLNDGELKAFVHTPRWNSWEKKLAKFIYQHTEIDKRREFEF